jgi:hypothetical protein
MSSLKTILLPIKNDLGSVRISMTRVILSTRLDRTLYIIQIMSNDGINSEIVANYFLNLFKCRDTFSSPRPRS